MAEVIIRKMMHQEIASVSNLMRSIFENEMADDFSASGKRIFREAISIRRIEEELKNGSFYLVAVVEELIIGVIALVNYGHVLSLFVHPDLQKQGIATALWNKAKAICYEKKQTQRFTVNASEGAKPIFEKFGFQDSTNVKMKNSVLFTPMRLEITTMNGKQENQHKQFATVNAGR